MQKVIPISFPVLLGSLLLLSSAAPFSNLSLSEVFPSGDADLSPPSLEGQLGEATEEGGGLNSVAIRLLDINGSREIRNAHIRIKVEGKTRIETLRFVGEDATLLLHLPDGSWVITLKLDILNTTGKDYYSRFSLSLSGDTNITAYMQPVGSLRGDVFDSNSHLVPGAEVKFECSGDYGETEKQYTDEYGSFSANWLPVGICHVSAKNSGVGSQTVRIKRGEATEVHIELTQSLIHKEDGMFPFLLLFGIGSLIGILIVLYKRSRGRNQHDEVLPKSVHPVSLTPRMKHILSGMDDLERRVMEVLLERGGQAKQRDLGRDLGIPKSTLSRLISGLEARGIVKREILGRTRRIELSDWFLNEKED